MGIYTPLRRTGIVILTLSTLVMVACSSGNGSDTTVTETVATEEEGGTADTQGGATTTAATVEDGAESLVISLDSSVDTLEPQTLRSTGAFAATGALYQGLLREEFEEQPDGLLLGTKEFTPNLAESWDTETTDEGIEVTFDLRDGPEFAEGDAITAEDFEWTLQRALESFLFTQLSLFGVDAPEDIEAVDEDTLVLRPDRTGPVFEQLMSHQHGATALNRSVLEEQATDDDPWAFNWLEQNATPNGPYVLGEYDPDTQVVLEPNPNYWNPDFPLNDGVTIRFIPDGEQRALLVRQGDLDLATGIPSRILADLEDEEGLNVFRAPSSRLHYLGMNTQMAPFDNVEVRRAISYAIPYQEIVDAALFGFGNPAGGFVSQNMDTYAGDELGNYSYDPDAARELIEASGAEISGVQLAVRQSRDEEQEAAVIIQSALREVGVDVEVSVLPDGEFFDRLNAKELPLWIHDWYQWGEDPFLLMSFLARSDAFTNYSQYNNATLDELIFEGLGEQDLDRRAEISRDAQEILLADAPMAYLYNKDWHAVARDNVSGVNRDMTEIMHLERLQKSP